MALCTERTACAAVVPASTLVRTAAQPPALASPLASTITASPGAAGDCVTPFTGVRGPLPALPLPGAEVDTPHENNQLSDLIFPPKTNAANERLAQHLWNHRDDLFTFLRQPGLDTTNWRAELAIRFGVILRKVWGGSRTWPGAWAQAVLMSVWRTCWQQGRSAMDFLSQLLRGTQVALALPP